jgi:hypothetical protein
VENQRYQEKENQSESKVSPRVNVEVAPSKEHPEVPQPPKVEQVVANSDSYTYEDLDEAIEDIHLVIDLLIKKSKQIEALI